VIRTFDMLLSVEGSVPRHDTAPAVISEIGDRIFRVGKGGRDTSAGWQATLCAYPGM